MKETPLTEREIARSSAPRSRRLSVESASHMNHGNRFGVFGLGAVVRRHARRRSCSADVALPAPRMPSPCRWARRPSAMTSRARTSKAGRSSMALGRRGDRAVRRSGQARPRPARDEEELRRDRGARRTLWRCRCHRTLQAHLRSRGRFRPESSSASTRVATMSSGPTRSKTTFASTPTIGSPPARQRPCDPARALASGTPSGSSPWATASRRF